MLSVKYRYLDLSSLNIVEVVVVARTTSSNSSLTTRLMKLNQWCDENGGKDSLVLPVQA
jgi:hypothetical protein